MALALVGLPVLMLALYAVGIQYQRESLPQWLRNVCECIAGFALLLDAVLNWSLFSLYLWEWPRWKENELQPEWTFSTRLERLIRQVGWRSNIARRIAAVLNFIAPSGRHIK
jgi:hypothetical protein